MAHSVEQHLPMLALREPWGKYSRGFWGGRRRAVDGRGRSGDGPCTNQPGATGMLS